MGDLRATLNKEIDLWFWKKYEERIITVLLCIVALGFPVIELISEMCGKPYAYQEGFLRGTGFVLLFFSFLCFIRNKKHTIVWSDIFWFLSVVLAVISIIFSLSVFISFNGPEKYLNEDAFQHLGYFMIFFMATQVKEYKNRKLIFKVIVIVAIMQTIPSLLQHFDIWPYDCIFSREVAGSYGLTGHYNYYAALAVMFSAMTMTMFIYKKAKLRWLWFIASILCFLATMYSWCRLAWVGLIAYIFLIPVIYLYQKKTGSESIVSMRYYIIMLVTYALICVYLICCDDVILSQLFETANELQEENGGRLGNGRMYIWKLGISAAKEHWLTGLGLDNYYYAIRVRPDLQGSFVPVKGHSEYIHTFVTQGLPALINYLCMCAYTFFYGIRNYIKNDKTSEEKLLTYAFVVMIFAYFAQALFNSSITNVAPYKWLIMGLLVPRASQKILWESKKGKI